jgi:hypothetical protein
MGLPAVKRLRCYTWPTVLTLYKWGIISVWRIVSC